MIINLIFDQSGGAGFASFVSGVESAALILEEAITDPISVTIEIGYGVFPNDPSQTPITGGAAEAEPNFDLAISAPLSSVVSALNAGAAPGDTNFDALTSTVVASGGTAITGYNGLVAKAYNQVLLWSAEAKALGFMPASGIDGFAGFATDINRNALVGVALHELTHALGRAPSGRGLQPFGDIPDIFDLFRFDSAHNLPLVSGDFGESPPAYFSVNGPVNSGGTVLANYGENSDPGDFLNDSLTVNDPFDEFYVPGATFQSLTLTDLIQLDVLGFNTITFSWTSGVSGNFAVASNWTSGGSSPSTSTPTAAPPSRPAYRSWRRAARRAIPSTREVPSLSAPAPLTVAL